MTAEVVIAYRDLGCPHRRASFEFVHAHYTRLGYPVIVESGDDTFTRAKAINTAIRRSSADIIIQSDPDSFVAPDALQAAVELAAQPGLVIPHDRYLYLTREATRAFYAGQPNVADYDVTGEGVGNVTVFSRATWQQAGGLDERFGMWGGDDAAFAYATEAFCGPLRRIPGDMIHLWHPRLPESVPGSPGFVEQFTLVAEYRDAAAAGTVRQYVEAR